VFVHRDPLVGSGSTSAVSAANVGLKRWPKESARFRHNPDNLGWQRIHDREEPSRCLISRSGLVECSWRARIVCDGRKAEEFAFAIWCQSLAEAGGFVLQRFTVTWETPRRSARLAWVRPCFWRSCLMRLAKSSGTVSYTSMSKNDTAGPQGRGRASFAHHKQQCKMMHDASSWTNRMRREADQCICRLHCLIASIIRIAPFVQPAAETAVLIAEPSAPSQKDEGHRHHNTHTRRPTR